MIGTIEALGVFLLAIVPGFVALRAYGYGKPPLRPRGALGELGATIVASAAAWTILYFWRGRDLLPIVLGDPRRPAAERLDAFAEITALSIGVGLVLGVASRAIAAMARSWVIRRLQPPASRSAARPGALARAKSRLSREARIRTLPNAAWDRLMTRLANHGEPVVCRVRTRAGADIVGVFAGAGFADWEADGRGLLLDKEMVRNADGRLSPIPSSQGIYIPGDEIAVLSVVSLPPEALRSTGADE